MIKSQYKKRITGKKILDVRGYVCPLPVLKARKRLMALQKNEVLQVLATDPYASEDFRRFCTETGYVLQKEKLVDGVFSFLIRKTV